MRRERKVESTATAATNESEYSSQGKSFESYPQREKKQTQPVRHEGGRQKMGGIQCTQDPCKAQGSRPTGRRSLSNIPEKGGKMDRQRGSRGGETSKKKSDFLQPYRVQAEMRSMSILYIGEKSKILEQKAP